MPYCGCDTYSVRDIADERLAPHPTRHGFRSFKIKVGNQNTRPLRGITFRDGGPEPRGSRCEPSGKQQAAWDELIRQVS